MRKLEDLVRIRRWHLWNTEWMEEWVPPFRATRNQLAVTKLLIDMVNNGQSVQEIYDNVLYEVISIADAGTIFYLQFRGGVSAA